MVITQVVRITRAVAGVVAQQVKWKIATATVAQILGLRMDIVMMAPTNGMVLQFT